MVFTRRYGRKRYGRKKVYKKRSYNRRRGVRTRSNGSKTYYFKRKSLITINLLNKNFVGAIALGGVNSDKLTDVPGYAEFQGMFDEFKICGISRKWIFDRNSAEIGGTNVSAPALPVLITYNDKNDDTEIADEAETLQVASTKQSQLNKPRSRYWKPQYAGAMIGSNSWHSTTASQTTVHYGLKWAITSNSTTAAENQISLGNIKLYTTYYLKFRGPK